MVTDSVGKLRAIGDAAGDSSDEVEFGLIVSAEAGAVLVASSAGAD
jgi:hypothetical protein